MGWGGVGGWYQSQTTLSRQKPEHLINSHSERPRLWDCWYGINKLCGRVRQQDCVWVRGMVGTDTSTADCWAELSFHDKDHFSTAHPLAWMMPAGNYGFTAQYFHRRLPPHFCCTRMLQTRCNLKHVIHSFGAGTIKVHNSSILFCSFT